MDGPERDHPPSRRQVLRALVAGGASLGVGSTATAHTPDTLSTNNDGGDGNAKGNESRGHIVGTDTPAATDEAERRANSVRHTLNFGKKKAVAGAFSQANRRALEQRPDVRYVEEDIQAEAVGEKLPWGIDRVDADIAHSNGTTGDGADIAVLDTGIDSDHPDLTDNLGSGKAYVDCGKDPDGNNCSDTNGNTCYELWDDDDDHGTHAAGVADAVNNDQAVIGVSTAATLHAVRVLGCGGAGYVSDIAAGLEYTTDQGWDVASMSLGASSDSQTLQDACQYADDNGVFLAAAAGNDGPCSDCVQYPAAYNSVVAVSATDSNDDFASFSSTGSEIEFAAPGESILSTVAGGTAYFSGTSIACPHVGGAAGLLMVNGYTNSEAQRVLQDTAEDIGLSGSEQGNGLLNVDAATATIDMIGEAGTVSINENWQTISLSGSYADPVVVASIGTYNDADPVHTRVRNTQSDSFEIKLEEWTYQDGVHSTETVNYVVMESGFHETSTGVDVLAGTVQADGSGWTTTNYGRTFDSQRYVFTQVMSVNDSTPVSTRVTDTGIESFDIFCQEEESNRSNEFSDHAQETVGYLVTQPRLAGSGDPGESIASVFATHNWSTGNLEDSYSSTPVILHGLQSYFGRDTTDLRGRNYSSTSFEVLAEEEQSANSETNHVREYVATLAFEEGDITER